MAPEMRLLRLFTRSSKGVVASYTEPSFEPPRGRTLERQSRSSPGPHHKRLRITAPTVATVEEEDCATSTTSSQDQIACEVEGSDGGSSAEVALANIDPRLLQLEESASALGEQQKCVRFDNRAIVHRYEQVEEEEPLKCVRVDSGLDTIQGHKQVENRRRLFALTTDPIPFTYTSRSKKKEKKRLDQCYFWRNVLPTTLKRTCKQSTSSTSSAATTLPPNQTSLNSLNTRHPHPLSSQQPKQKPSSAAYATTASPE